MSIFEKICLFLHIYNKMTKAYPEAAVLRNCSKECCVICLHNIMTRLQASKNSHQLLYLRSRNYFLLCFREQCNVQKMSDCNIVYVCVYAHASVYRENKLQLTVSHSSFLEEKYATPKIKHNLLNIKQNYMQFSYRIISTFLHSTPLHAQLTFILVD
jgi:hypothetical protein